MAAEAGWYPDPEGDKTRLRYWNGTQWTNDYYSYHQQNQQEADPSPTSTLKASVANASEVANRNTTAVPQTNNSSAEAQATTLPISTSAMSNMSYQLFDVEQVYPMTNQDRVFRLIVFLLNIISCLGWAMLIIPLAWMIPMTICSWNIYKGKRANTTAFGVCTLIFLNLISGILLLLSLKDTPQSGNINTISSAQ